MTWFPRPHAPEDVRTIPPLGRWTAEGIYQLLSDPGGVEWRDRVGVAGRANGSAKSSVRLMLIRDWVAKTSVDHVSATEHDAEQHLVEARAPGLEADLWHPEKQWATFRSRAGWLPLTLCPELKTLREQADIGQRLRLWAEMLRVAVRIYDDHGLGLDLNPANFGTRGDDPTLFYIDDEVYPTLAERDVAGAIVQRVPEEPELGRTEWKTWARMLVDSLAGQWPKNLSWDRLCDEMRRYPVAEMFARHRDEIVTCFEETPRKQTRPRPGDRMSARGPHRVCVLADVHGNLPALEATLDAARKLGADGYLFLGDAVGYGPHPSECITRLARLRNALFIRGNHDHAIATGQLDVGMNRLARECARWTISALDRTDLHWLRRLPVDHATEDWMAVHGAPRDPRRFFAYVYDLTFEDNLTYLERTKMPLCFHGHTHVQLVHVQQPSGPTKLIKPTTVELDPRRFTLVNPGSVGQPRDGDCRAAFAIWDQGKRQVSFHRVTYDIERTLQDLHARKLPSQLAERLTAGT